MQDNDPATSSSRLTRKLGRLKRKLSIRSSETETKPVKRLKNGEAVAREKSGRAASPISIGSSDSGSITSLVPETPISPQSDYGSEISLSGLREGGRSAGLGDARGKSGRAQSPISIASSKSSARTISGMPVSAVRVPGTQADSSDRYGNGRGTGNQGSHNPDRISETPIPAQSDHGTDFSDGRWSQAGRDADKAASRQDQRSPSRVAETPARSELDFGSDPGVEAWAELERVGQMRAGSRASQSSESSLEYAPAIPLHPAPEPRRGEGRGWLDDLNPRIREKLDIPPGFDYSVDPFKDPIINPYGIPDPRNQVRPHQLPTDAEKVQKAAARREHEDAWQFENEQHLFLDPHHDPRRNGPNRELLTNQDYFNNYGIVPDPAQASFVRSADGRLDHTGYGGGGILMICRHANGSYAEIRPELGKAATLEKCIEKYGQDNLWLKAPDGKFLRPDDYDAAHGRNAAQKRFSGMTGRALRDDIPQVLVGVTPDHFVSAAHFARMKQSGMNQPDMGYVSHAASQKPVLVLAPMGNSYLVPSQVRKDHPEYYSAVMRKTGMDPSIADQGYRAPKGPPTLINRGDGQFFSARVMNEQAKAAGVPLHELVEEKDVFIANTVNGRSTGNYAGMSAYRRFRDMTREQLTGMGFPAPAPDRSARDGTVPGAEKTHAGNRPKPDNVLDVPEITPSEMHMFMAEVIRSSAPPESRPAPSAAGDALSKTSGHDHGPERANRHGSEGAGERLTASNLSRIDGPESLSTKIPQWRDSVALDDRPRERETPSR